MFIEKLIIKVEPRLFRLFCRKVKQERSMRRPGIEPRANAWRAFMLPLHHRRLRYVELRVKLYIGIYVGIVHTIPTTAKQ